jgi:hypothetical protein
MGQGAAMPAYREVRLLSVAEAAYLAGLIDGEGRSRERRIFEDSLLGLRAPRKKKPLQSCG